MVDLAYLYQVKEGLTREYAFMSYDYITKVYGDVDLNNYIKVAEIEIPEDVIGADEVLNYVYNYGNTNQLYYANNPEARSISVSDIILYNNIYYYVDSVGFTELSNINKAEEGVHRVAEADEPYIDNETDNEIDSEDKTLLDYLQDRIGQQITVAELNTILQSLFSRYNDIFILDSDLYNADLDETQQLSIWEDEDNYIIDYDIIDVSKGIIEITDVNVE